MANKRDNRVLGRIGARELSDQEDRKSSRRIQNGSALLSA
jgi:hypothetical protein